MSGSAAMASARTTAAAAAKSRTASTPKRLAGRPGQREADGQQGQRAHPVEGGDAREGLRRHALLHGGVPEGLEHPEGGAAERRRGRDQPGRRAEGQERRGWGLQHEEERRAVQRAPRPPAQGERPAGHAAQAVRREDGRPGAGAPQVAVGDHGAEHVERGVDQEQPDAGHHDGDPEPAPRADLAEALCQVVQERPPLAPGRGPADAQAQQEGRADGEGGGVEGERAARPGQHHEHAADGRPGDRPRVVGEGQEGVGLLQPPRRHALGHQPGGRRAEEGLGRPVDDLQGGQQGDGHAAADEQRRRRAPARPSARRRRRA